MLWDSANIAHIARHDITPEEVEQVLANDPIDLERSIRDSEPRLLHLGHTDAGRVLYVVVTTRGDENRCVTAWPANKSSRRFYRTQRKGSFR